MDHRTEVLESTKGLLHRLHKRLEIALEISPTLREFCVLLRCQALHTANGTQLNFAKREEINVADATRIRWRRVVNVNETIDIRSLLSRGPEKYFK